MRGYTQQQMAWLAASAKGSTWRSLTEAYNARYGTAHSVQRLKTHCNRHGIYVVGALGGKTSWNEKPIGHVCPTSNGYARVKTESGYKMLARLNIPDNRLVCCHFDGDKMSADAEYHSKKAMRLYALQCRYNCGFAANRKTAMTICELDVAVSKTKKGAKMEEVSE